jgi:hypothetical protein
MYSRYHKVILQTRADPVRGREGSQLIESEDSSESERRASASNGADRDPSGLSSRDERLLLTG